MRWLGLLPAFLTLVVLISPTLPLVGKAIVAAAFVIALANPAEGLLFAVGLAPLGTLIAAAFDINGVRLTEAIVVAFLAGWLLRGFAVSEASPPAQSVPGPPRYAVRAAWLLGAFIVASFAGLGWQLSGMSPALTMAIADLGRAYFQVADPIGVVEGAKLLEGLALFAAVVVLFRRRPALAVELPVALAASAIAATAATLLVWRGLGPLPLLQQYARMGYRVAANVPDVNAAGSYFVLILCLSMGMTLRARGRARGGWIAAAVACVIGLWWSESRTALAAAGGTIALAALWAVSLPWRPRVRIAACAALIVLVAAISLIRFGQLERDPTYLGSGLRSQFVTTSFRMIAAHPLVGFGAGRYYPESTRFLSPRLAWTYGLENAHNNFLQIAAETGVVGFALFGLVVAAGLATGARALIRTPYDWRLLGAFAGVVGLLVTCLTSHPLLVTEVAVAFWVQFGLVVGLGSSTLVGLDAHGSQRPARAGFTLSLATALGAALVVLSVPMRAFQPAPATPASADVDGFYLWETGTDGVRFRWTREYASLFASPDATRIEIPIRAPQNPSQAKTVEISVAGVYRGEYGVSDRWTTIPLDLQDAAVSGGIKRINLKAGGGWRGSGGTARDQLGLQIGEARITRPRK